MKKLFVLCILICIISFSLAIEKAAAAETYYIYVKHGDNQFFQTKYGKTVSISYVCKCYVNKTNLSFICIDDSKGTTYKSNLPPQYYSMTAFAEIALKKSKAGKNADLNTATIYVIEDYQHKYRYFQVKFYTA